MCLVDINNALFLRLGSFNMFTSKLNNILFGTAVSLFLVTLVSHFSSADLEDESDYQSYGASLASKVIPSFSGSGGLGSVKTHITRSERQYQEMLEGRAWLKTQWEDPNNKKLYVALWKPLPYGSRPRKY